MSSSITRKQTVMPHRTMQGHAAWVQGVVHLPGGRRIIICLDDGSLRLWDLESGKQIGEDWRDKGDKEGVKTIALSPNGNVIATGSNDGTVRLWDVEMGKVIAKWAGHTENVLSVCWSAGSKRVVSGSSDGTARVWDVTSGETVLAIETGHVHVWAGIYSPDQTMFATGGFKQHGIKIWDAKTGKLLVTLEHNRIVFSLAWTSDGKKLISTSYGPITIFDTATWQEIAILEGHKNTVWAISLSRHNRLLASASDDNTAHLWNLDTNLPVGPPLHHEHEVTCAAFSADGTVLVTSCEDKNAYVWDVHAILKEVGLKDFFRDIPAPKSLMNFSNTTRSPPIQVLQVLQVPQGFFDGVQNGAQFSTARGTCPHSAAHHTRSTRAPLLARFSSLSRHSHYNTDNAAELQQRQRRTIFTRGPHIVEVAARRDREVLFVATGPVPNHGATARSFLARLVLFACCASPQHIDVHAQPTQQQEGQPQGQAQTHATSSPTQQQQGQSHGQVQAQGSPPQAQPAAPSTSATPTSSSRSDGLISRLFSLFRCQPPTNEDMRVPQHPGRPNVVKVAAMDDKGTLFVSGPQPDPSHPQSAGTATPGAKPAHSLPVQLLAHLTHATSSQTQQQQAQTQGQDQAEVSSSQTQPAAPLTSATPTSSSRDVLISRLSSLFRPQTDADEEIELSELPSRPHVFEVATVHDMSFSGVMSDD
ncbi:WD40-repeat-containing domain protein [Suillus subalutaceus]|uniref:WD40-repeat-containing domain protein n=1 Tax=Suillus subalutaceus TaxID=48586 RepID=UPI001B882735|nr:WD40-repeat-containing domain protein [Suillus subalutaceus]KAG1861744.1 WD40-repeat-containing domain protein [Suillus subalutaceus]